MEIIYGKKLNDEQNKIVTHIANECGILLDTAKLLFYRNVDTVEKAKAFLSPSKKGFIDPYNFNQMDEAVARIRKAKDMGENVLIFGDYDADGVCATTVLYYCLKEFGITANCFVPERDEGYGLNYQRILKINQEKNINLLITVDCGISSRDTINEIKALGIDVIVTDHHEPPEELPECININPKLIGQKYPFSELCGAGVAYKLGYALIGEKADEYLDFVALATVADSMDLTGENRHLVVEGLKLFNSPKTLRLPFSYLLGDNNKQITAQTIAYSIAPRVNAGGRMGDANSVLKLFTATDKNEIFDLSVLLNNYNISRQAECDRIYREAKEKIKAEKRENDKVILVNDPEWKVGFIGIVAAKLVEEYCRPVIVFAGHDDYLKGSARSIESFNIYDAITEFKDILIAYGGHSQAAGVSVKKEDFETLSKRLNDYVDINKIVMDTRQKIYAEWNVNSNITMRFAKEIDLLEPFGVGNRRPLFTTDVLEVDSVPLKSGSAHYSFKTDVLEMLDFNGEKNVLPLSLPIEKKVVFEINLSSYKNRESMKGYVRSVCPNYGDFSGIKYEVFSKQLDTLLTDGTTPNLHKIKRQDLTFNKDTLFIINSIDNLKNYPEFDVDNISVFDVLKKNGLNLSIIPPENVVDCESVVYLDTPIQYGFSDKKVAVVEDYCGYSVVDNLSVDRNVFIEYFTIFKTLTGKSFKGEVRFCKRYFSDLNIYQALFVLKVFLELKIFFVKNGVFCYDEKVKNTLTNSKVYSKIYTLKG